MLHRQDLCHSDGVHDYRSLLVRSVVGDGDRPAVLLFPEAWGLGTHTMDRAERLAARGYVTLAVDPYGGRMQAKDLAEAVALMGDLQTDVAARRTLAAHGLAMLAAQGGVDRSRIAAIGFCFGGLLAFELARSGADIAAAVSFHGGLGSSAPAKPGVVRAKILACVGADDPAADLGKVGGFLDEMRQARVDHQLIAYGHAVHSFTNPDADGSMPGVLYDEKADRRSWDAMCLFLDEVFAPPSGVTGRSEGTGAQGRSAA